MFSNWVGENDRCLFSEGICIEYFNDKMRNTFLPFSPPLIGEEEIIEVVDTLRGGWITTGPKVRRFEEEFATFVGSA